MTCTKCGGLVVDEAFDPRCVNCGRPPGWEQMRHASAEETTMKCKCCSEPAEEGRKMCRTHLDKACEQAKAYAAKRRAAQGGAVQVKMQRGGATAVVKAAPKIAITRPVTPAASPAGDALEAIDEAIAGRLGEVQILERAKAILSRA